jgi:hypothetical protein
MDDPASIPQDRLAGAVTDQVELIFSAPLRLEPGLPGRDSRPECDRGYGRVLRVCSDAANRPASDGINGTELRMSQAEIPYQRTSRRYTNWLTSIAVDYGRHDQHPPIASTGRVPQRGCQRRAVGPSSQRSVRGLGWARLARPGLDVVYHLILDSFPSQLDPGCLGILGIVVVGWSGLVVEDWCRRCGLLDLLDELFEVGDLVA